MGEKIQENMVCKIHQCVVLMAIMAVMGDVSARGPETPASTAGTPASSAGTTASSAGTPASSEGTPNPYVRSSSGTPNPNVRSSSGTPRSTSGSPNTKNAASGQNWKSWQNLITAVCICLHLSY